MKRILLYMAMFAVLNAALASVFSAQTSIELAKYRANSLKTMNGAYQNTILQAFVIVDNPSVLAQLKSQGVTINSQFGNTITASFPLNRVDDVAKIKGVKHISLSRRLTLCNDKARELSRFPTRTYNHDGYPGFANSGNGVVVGMIDVGVDFNHINFLDKEGNSRIVRVYMPADSTGTAPCIDGMVLPGSEYTTPDQISMLTTDDPSMAHGTHTTGTAAGSYTGNGYFGVATEAQIVVCAMSENYLSDVNIANSVRYIFDYADKAGVPAVVNMSLGDQVGAHDGSSPLCQLFDEVSGPGRICVVSAGNDADMPMNVRKKLGESDSLATFLSNWFSRDVMSGYSSMWSRSAQRHTVDIVIWDIKQDSMLYRLDIPHEAQLDSVYMVSNETDSIFAQYFTGELYFSCTLEDNGLFHSLVETNYSTIDRSRYRIGLINKAPKGETLMGWSGGQVVYSKAGLAGWTGGTVGYGCTVSDLATADSVISVGAYCSNDTFMMMDGDTLTISDCTPYDIAYFSGFGPDARNRRRPDLVAPGYVMASSVSRYVEAYQNLSNIVDNVNVNGINYPYGLEGGTSMSAPMVSGAIALWLEIDSTLSPSGLREIMEATCYRDTYVENGAAKKWGYGKLDIAAGIKYLMDKLDGDVNRDGALNASDITCLYNILLGHSVEHIQCADVDGDGTVTAADISRLYNSLLE